ncbi:acid phosphatase [Rhodococcus aerolatus]
MHTAASPPDHQHRVILLRHGQTEWSQSGQHTGTTDIPLTEDGVAQARAAADLVTALELDHPTVITSPRRRATRTAELAGLDVDEQTEDLAEWDYGEYEGLTTPEIRETVPGWTVWTHPCPGGETAEQVQARADRILGRARAVLLDGDVVLVGHGHFSRALLARWVGMGVTAGIHFGMSPAGLAVLGQEHGQDQIVAMNITPALP